MDSQKVTFVKVAKSFGAGIFKGFALGVKHEGQSKIADIDGNGPKAYFEKSFNVLIFIFILKFAYLYRPEGFVYGE